MTPALLWKIHNRPKRFSVKRKLLMPERFYFHLITLEGFHHSPSSWGYSTGSRSQFFPFIDLICQGNSEGLLTATLHSQFWWVFIRWRWPLWAKFHCQGHHQNWTHSFGGISSSTFRLGKGTWFAVFSEEFLIYRESVPLERGQAVIELGCVNEFSK